MKSKKISNAEKYRNLAIYLLKRLAYEAPGPDGYPMAEGDRPQKYWEDRVDMRAEQFNQEGF